MAGLSERHLRLIENRGLDPEVVSRHGIETCGARGEEISIPYLVGAEVVNHKFRTLEGEKRFRQDKDARKTFWNYNVITDSTLAEQPLIITEGELDALAAIQAGYQRAVSVPDGAPAQAMGDEDRGAKYSYLQDAKAALEPVKKIILATDGDGPGINLMNDLALRLGKHRCLWVKYPRGCKDLADAIRLYKERGVTETINRARWVEVNSVYRMSELPPIANPPALDCGMPELARHWKLRLGDFVVVLGCPNHGKSVFVQDVACRMVVEHGWPVAFASFETQPQVDHRRQLRTWYGQRLPEYQRPEELAEADRWIDQNFSFICPSFEDEVTAPWLLEKAAAAVTRYGARIVVFDPVNEMDHIRPDGVLFTEYIGEMIKQFRRFARKYNVLLIIVVHPTKLPREKDGKLPMPTLYDASDSAHYANKCDVGVIVHRDGSKTTIRVAKVRFQDAIGEPGQFTASFDRNRARFVPDDDSGQVDAFGGAA